jgi:hypothetical protein
VFRFGPLHSEDLLVALASGLIALLLLAQGHHEETGDVEGVRPEKVRIEANRCNPARDKPSLLPGGHAAAVITTANAEIRPVSCRRL